MYTNPVEQYLAEVSRVIVTNFRPTDPVTQSMTAARAGLLVQQVMRCSPVEGGFAKFADVLRELERRGNIRVGFNSKKALAIWLPEQKPIVGVLAKPIVSPYPEPNTAPFRRLQNPVWLAFIAESPVGRRFMHKRTGQILLGQSVKPDPSDEWVEIEPVDRSAELSDARAFLRSEGRDNDDELLRELESPTWFRSFSASLQRTDSFLASKWKRRRSNRVIGRVEQWRRANGIVGELVYEAPQTRTAPIPAPASPISEKDTRLRDAIISAIRQMRTDELLELRVPAKHLVNALRPDFVNR